MEIEKQKKVMDRLEKENQELKERLHSFATHNCSDCNCEFCCEAVFATFKDTALALALVSTLVVEELIVKGPRAELACASLE